MSSKLGKYISDTYTFTSKIQAFVHANTKKSDVKWWFYDELWENANWNIEPAESLKNLYKNRAQEIRDQYDYIAVMYSGGADSTNVVYSFIDNNIVLDEIIAGAPISGIKKLKMHCNTIDPSNIISETKYAQLPGIKEIQEKNHKIKITIHDYFEDMITIKGQEWLYNLSHWVNPSVVRHRLEKLNHLKKIAEQGKKIAILYGIDKPILYRTATGDLKCVITDNSINFLAPHFDENIDNIDTVLFYFDPYNPRVLIKEIWEIAKFFYRPENTKLRNLYMPQYNSPIKNRHLRASMYQRLIVPTIYPDITHIMKTKFQAAKTSLGFTGNQEIDSWVYQLYKNEKFLDIWQTDFKELISHLDNTYLDKDTGFKTFYKSWKICNESFFINN